MAKRKRPYIKGIDGEDSLLSKPTKPVKGIDYDTGGLLGNRQRPDDEE